MRKLAVEDVSEAVQSSGGNDFSGNISWKERSKLGIITFLAPPKPHRSKFAKSR